MRRRLVSWFAAMALLVVWFHCSNALACGPFTLEAIFVHTVHPDFPLERFARGEIGVVQPNYARSYLYVAYRYLAASGFDPQEQKALTDLWKERLDSSGNQGEEDWIKAWLAARQRVAGLSEPPKIDVYRSREKPNDYQTYLNCRKDAFDSAIATLDARIGKYGVESPAVRDWIAGQDQVFANCSEGQHLPAPVSSNADALFRADRAYQIAAANFYSSNFAEAQKGFEAIAADNTSPWQRIAPYLIARTLVRKASLGAAETKNDSLAQAETQLKRILADEKLSSSHHAAARLLDLVRLQLRPKERLHELAHALATRTPNSSLKQELWDYTVLLDGFLEDGDAENKVTPPADILTDDLTDWITTVQAGTTEARDHSLAKWQSSHSPAWLVASLSKIDGKHARADELISQAMKVESGSAAFASARFHAARLLVESGRASEARTLLDQLLKRGRSQFDQSSWNLLVGQRMLLAGSLAEFLNYAPRIPASFSWNDDGREIPAEASELADESKALQGKPLLDLDAASILNRKLPLSVLKEAAKSPTLPLHLRRDLAQAAWLRAVVLGDSKTADDLVPTLKTLVPALSTFLDDFLSTTQPNAKRFSAIYTWLKFPGMEPLVDQGIGRQIPLSQQDTYRDNWWCLAAFPRTEGTEEKEGSKPRSFTAGADSVPAFLTEPERAVADKEYSALTAKGAAPNYLCQQVIQWVTKTPTDPRAPEALHLAVKSTRYGCTDQETGRWSKAAFDLLHRKYANTIWARKTPYWFKD